MFPRPIREEATHGPYGVWFVQDHRGQDQQGVARHIEEGHGWPKERRNQYYAALRAVLHAVRYEKVLTNRDVIAQAKGILMELFTIDPVTAFSMLAQLSKDCRQPVSAVARGLVSMRSEGCVATYLDGRGHPSSYHPRPRTATDCPRSFHAGL
jgi:hypothetical protein